MSTQPEPGDVKNELPEKDNHLRGSRGVLLLLIAAVLVAYGLPFFGIWLSAVILLAVHLRRRRLCGAGAPRRPLLAVLVWLGLWLPAISYSLTGWYWEVAGRDLSTAWLLLPLCGPEGMAGLVVPAVVATLVFAAGLAASVVRANPWMAVAAAWIAPWSHELALVALGSEMVC